MRIETTSFCSFAETNWNGSAEVPKSMCLYLFFLLSTRHDQTQVSPGRSPNFKIGGEIGASYVSIHGQTTVHVECVTGRQLPKMGVLAKIQIVMIFAILTAATLYIIVGHYVAEESHPRELVILSNSPGPPRERIRRPSNGTSNAFISGVEATKAHENVPPKKAEKICRSILFYGGVRVTSNTEKECIAFVLEYPSAWRCLFDKIRQYVAWHNLTHCTIQEQLKMGNNLKSVLGGLRTLSYNCNTWPRCTGYGSQMQNTFAGFILAMLTKRFSTVEWPSNFKGSDKWVEVFTPTVVNWNLDPPFSSELLRPKLCSNCAFASSKYEAVHLAYSTQYRHVYYRRLTIPLSFCEDSNESDMEPQHMAYFCKKAKVNKYIKQNKFVLFINGIICRLMYRFSDIVVERGEKRLREMGFLHSSFVAVHIRTALEESSKKMIAYHSKLGRHQDDINSWKAFIDCGKMAASNHSINKPLLLISDSSDCINWVSHKYPSNKVIYSNSSFWHFAEHSGAIESDENINKILDTISDLYLISKATVVVKGISEFSKIGIHLGSISNSNVVRCDLGIESLLQKRMIAFNKN